MYTNCYIEVNGLIKLREEVKQQVREFMKMLVNDKNNNITLLDYYRNFSISPNQFLEILSDLRYDVREQRQFSKMSKVHECIEIERNPEFFLADSFKFGYRKYTDENDRSKFVDVFITQEEKKEIIEYFLEYDIPLYVSVFNMAMREKFNGTFEKKSVSKNSKKEENLMLSDQKLYDFKTQLANGIELGNGETRDFGILDYYQFFNVCPSIVIEQYGQYLINTEKKQLIDLEHEYFNIYGIKMKNERYLPEIRIAQPYHFIMNSKYIKNKHGNLVLDMAGVTPDDIYRTTEEERLYAFEYVLSHKMEQTEKIFTAVLRAYIENKLPEQLSEKQCVKKKQF